MEVVRIFARILNVAKRNLWEETRVYAATLLKIKSHGISGDKKARRKKDVEKKKRQNKERKSKAPVKTVAHARSAMLIT